MKENSVPMIDQKILKELSHEIKTPLTSIMGFIDLIKKFNSNPELDGFINAVCFNSRHLLDVVQNLENIYLLAEPQIGSPSTLNLMEELEAAVGQREGLFLADEVAFTLMPQGLLPEQIQFAPDLLRKMLKIFLSYCIDSIEHGSVSIQVTYHGRALPNRQSIELAFKNTSPEGDSVDNNDSKPVIEFQKKITNLQLDYITDLIHNMGGSVQINKEQRDLLTIQLPISTKQDAAFFSSQDNDNAVHNTSTNVHHFRSPLKARKILLAEDSPDLQLLVKNNLKPYAIEVDTAFNGSEALNLLKENQYDMVLMDLQMPSMGGIECFEKMRELSIETPTVAFTAGNDPSEKEKCLRTGFSSYLTKPFSEGELLDTIKGVLLQEAPKAGHYNPQINLFSEDPEIKRVFSENLYKQMGRIKTSLAAKNWTDMSKVVHQLKGSALCYGKNELGDLCLQLEGEIAIAKADRDNKMDLLVEKIEAVSQRILSDF